MRLQGAKKWGEGRRLCSVLLTLMLAFGTVLPSYAAEGAGDETVTPERTEETQSSGDWTISRSKTATQLTRQDDGTYTSDVMLSLPSTEEVLESDVVFVLDESDCGDSVYADMWKLMEQLNAACEENPGAKLNVGVVFFRGCASTAYPLQEYNPNGYDEFKQAILDAKDSMIYKGTNLPAGLYAGKKMLEASSTPASRQHLIVISDGATYLYTEIDSEGNPTGKWETHYSRTSGYGANDGGLYEWNCKYEDYPGAYRNPFANGGTPQEWDAFLKKVASEREGFDHAKYDQVYVRTAEKGSADLVKPDPVYTKDNISSFVTNVEESLYQSAEVYKSIQSTGVKCYAYHPADTDRGVFTTFMDYLVTLGEGGGTDFDWITEDIIHLLDKGSVVEDVIGLGTDDQGNEYNFDFVNQADKLTLKVGDTSYACTKMEDDHYGFGDYDKEQQCYPYELIYHPADDPEKDGEQEYFEWKFNVPVSNFARAELTYQVVLTNPQTTPGTYTGLLTNRRATLHAVATDERTTDVDFEKPVVSYTVPGTPGTPEENTTPASPATPGTEAETHVETHVATTNVAVGKVWQDNENQDGIRPDSVTVQLYCNGTAYGRPVVLNQDNSWWYRWDNLSADAAWTVDEVNVADGYTKTITKNAVNAWVIVNTHTPETKVVETSVNTPNTTVTPQNPTGRGAGTGDESTMVLWLVVMLVSGSVLAGTVVYRRRRRG